MVTRYVSGTPRAAAADSTDNLNIADVIGNKEDAANETVNVSSVVALLRQALAEITVVDGFHDVPTADSTDNLIIADVIGNRLDSETTSTLAGRTLSIEEHAHSVQFVFPDLDDAVAVTADAAAWELSAAFVEVIPANAINTTFDLHYASLAFDANDEYQLNVYAGEVLIASVDGERNTNQIRLADSPVQMTIQPANTQIQVKLACKSTNANAATVKFKGHRY